MIILAGIVVLLLIICVYMHHDEKGKLIDRMFPGPTRIPFLGLLPSNVYPFERFYKYAFELGETFNYQPIRIWLFRKPYIVIADSKTAKIILSKLKFTDKMDLYYALEPWLGRNHLLGTGEEWLKYRKLDSSVLSLHDHACAHHLKIVDTNCDRFCQNLSKHDGKKAFDVHEYICMYALANLYVSLTGLPIKDETTLKPWMESYDVMENLLFLRTFIPILNIDWIYNLTPAGRRQKKSIQILRNLSREILRKKREAQENDGFPEDRHDQTEAYDLIQRHLLENKFTDEQIQIEMEYAMFGGHDTLGTSLCYLFYSLAEHPHFQEKIYNEMEDIFGEDDTCPDISQLNKMKFAEQFIHETMRYYTTVFNIGRFIKEDVYINEHQYIPKDTNVIISLGAIHKNPTHWPNPDVFDPDRFSEEMIRDRDPYSFLAFSAGPRNCIGIKFAMLIMKTTIAKVVRRFKLSLSDNPEEHVKLALNFVTQSTNGFNVKVESRKFIKENGSTS